MLKAIFLAIWFWLSICSAIVEAKDKSNGYKPLPWVCTHDKSVKSALAVLHKYDETWRYKEVHRLCDCLEREDKKGRKGNLKRCSKPRYLEYLARKDMVDACECLHWKAPPKPKTTTTVRKTTTTKRTTVKTTIQKPTTTRTTRTTTSKPTSTTKKTTTTTTKKPTSTFKSTATKKTTTNKSTTTKKTTTTKSTTTKKTTTTKPTMTKKTTTTTKTTNSKSTTSTSSTSSTSTSITTSATTSTPTTSTSTTVEPTTTESSTTTASTDTTTTTTVPDVSSITDAESSTPTPTSSSTTTTFAPVETPPGTDGFRPPIRSTYEGCVFDPTGTNFEVIDAGDGIVIRNENSAAIKPTTIEIWDTVDSPFTFVQAPNAPRGIFDLVYADAEGKVSFLAALESGRVIFTEESSKGQAFADLRGTDGQRFITSLFTYSCDGKLSMGIIGGLEYEFSLVENALYARPTNTNSVPGTSRKALLYKAPDNLPPIPTTESTLDKRQYSTGGMAPRCPNTPRGLKAIVNPKATRKPEVNGCGPNNGVDWVPDFNFGQCCNEHDLCFDNCDRAFEPCNLDFWDCNLRQCDRDFERVWYKPWNYPLYRGCATLASVYFVAVSLPSGADVFDKATADLCICECADTTKRKCWNTCADLSLFMADRDNCGACENKCVPAFVCQNGNCVCPGETETCPNIPDQCFALKTDNNNCGTCGNKCPYGTTCKNGTCICDIPGLNICDNGLNKRCYNLQTSYENCGTCNNRCNNQLHGLCHEGTCKCKPGEVICNGNCVYARNDPNNCGQCGNVCSGSTPICSGSKCVAPIVPLAECQAAENKSYREVWVGEQDRGWDDLDDRWQIEYITVYHAKDKVECCSACLTEEGGCLYHMFATNLNTRVPETFCTIAVQKGVSKNKSPNLDRETCPYGGLYIKPFGPGMGTTEPDEWGTMPTDAEMGPCGDQNFQFCPEPGVCF